jgi:hypothetical protein
MSKVRIQKQRGADSNKKNTKPHYICPAHFPQSIPIHPIYLQFTKRAIEDHLRRDPGVGAGNDDGVGLLSKMQTNMTVGALLRRDLITQKRGIPHLEQTQGLRSLLK